MEFHQETDLYEFKGLNTKHKSFYNEIQIWDYLAMISHSLRYQRDLKYSQWLWKCNVEVKIWSVVNLLRLLP